MKYITSLQAAEKWKLTKRRVNALCQEGLIPGAYKDGYRWRIPENFEYTGDAKSEYKYPVVKELVYEFNDCKIAGINYEELSMENMILREDGNYYPRRPLPEGITSFKKIANTFCYIDKTMLIHDLIEKKNMVTLFTRPRRFGKTLNMEMLRTFFEISDEDTSVYFKDKKIWQCGEEFRMEQGKYPVIFLSFKDIKYISWEKTFSGLKDLIADEYRRHDYLKESEFLIDHDKNYIEKVISGDISDVSLAISLKRLSFYLKLHHKTESIIIIDEYDTPINAGFNNGYYEEVTEFMRNFLSGGLKDNNNLKQGFMTGILRVAKNSIFSGLNNISVYSVLDERYSQYFGFTFDEVKGILYEYGKSNKLDEIMEWYDGYRFGDREIFNPWSVIAYANAGFKADSYWKETGSNSVLGEMMSGISDNVMEQLNHVLLGEEVLTFVDDTVVYPDIRKNSEYIFSYLMMAGYLTAESKESWDGMCVCRLRVPNKEVMLAYKREIMDRYCGELSKQIAIDVNQGLHLNNADKLQQGLETFLINSVSFYDTATESFYHGLVLGMTAMFTPYYEVTSNKEEGKGRYDIMLRPRDDFRNGYVIELKALLKKKGESVDEDDKLEERLEVMAGEAIEQINNKEYCVGLRDGKCKEIVKIGIAFYKKMCKVCIEKERG